jgi:hypothetical protein
MLVWAIVVQHHYTHHPPGKLDWTSPNFGRGFGLYVMINVAGNCVQNYLCTFLVFHGRCCAKLTNLI